MLDVILFCHAAAHIIKTLLMLSFQAGFSQGLSFGTEEFGMEDFDPLNQSK